VASASRIPMLSGPLFLWHGERIVKDGWIKLYRKSVDSQVFANDYLWKLWCLCLLKANHKMEYVPIDGIVEPVKVEPGQFITGRFELHADYHQRRRGYEKRFPSPRTVWRWLVSLRNMQNLTIKSSSKYSIISITNWHTYQESDQLVTNGCPTGDHKQEVNKNDKESMSAKKVDPHVKTFILEWIEIWSQKFGKAYTPSWGKEGKLIKQMLKIHSLPELREFRDDFFRANDPFIAQSDYSIGFFRAMVNKLVASRKLDPVEQARQEMRTREQREDPKGEGGL